MRIGGSQRGSTGFISESQQTGTQIKASVGHTTRQNGCLLHDHVRQNSTRSLNRGTKPNVCSACPLVRVCWLSVVNPINRKEGDMPRVKRNERTKRPSVYDTLIRFLTEPLTIAWLKLIEDDTTLNETYQVWRDYTDYRRGRRVFTDAVKNIIGSECIICTDCDTVVWEQNSTTTSPDGSVCEGCIEDYSRCDQCLGWSRYIQGVNGGDNYYCDTCVSDYCSYCDDCECYYTGSYADDHDHHGCECEAPHRSFKFPADGHGLITEDERLVVELPKGTIDDQGVQRIKNLLYSDLAFGTDWNIIETAVESVGSLWQTKRGNFTRRLASAFHKHETKIPPSTISEIGNVGRAHSSEDATWHIELTRDLNLSAEAFANEESCWWTGYSYARCALKNWGGLGLRTFSDDEDSYASGRAWVQPLNQDLKPTHDTENARAYVVYNGYGDLEGYVAARIIAHLTGNSYRKVEFGSDRQYVNGESGYLVADEATCEAHDRLWFNGDEHDQRDAHSFKERETAA